MSKKSARKKARKPSVYAYVQREKARKAAGVWSTSFAALDEVAALRKRAQRQRRARRSRRATKRPG